MSQNHKARRAAKAKARHQRAREHHGQQSGRHQQENTRTSCAPPQPSPEPPHGATGLDSFAIDTAIESYLRAIANPVSTLASNHLAVLEDHNPPVRSLVQQRLWRALRLALGEAWARGWLPLDVERSVARHPALGKNFGALPQQLVRDLIADDLASHASLTVDQRIHSQAAELGAVTWWQTDQLPLTARLTTSEAQSESWRVALVVVLLLLVLLRHVRPLPTVCPPPGEAAASPRTREQEIDGRVLERVRLLLAKAESTTFDAEAETFTAGAQALMARYSIDAAMLAASASGAGDGPQQTRIYLYAPYEDAKSRLLQSICRANRCQAVLMTDLGCGSVVGFPSDLLAVEALFTSLLVQSTAAMQRLGSKQDRYGRSRTRAFRSSFLVSFADRIGERLLTVTEAETAKATAEAGVRGQDLLPVLAAREDEVAAEFDRLFPQVERRASRRSYDAEGWRAGRQAADDAELAYGGQVSQ